MRRPRTFALYDFRRFWWATRSLTGLIFVGYAGYVVYECFFSGRTFGSDGPASPQRAIAGLLIFGLPALWYTVFGRFSLRKTEIGTGTGPRTT